MQALGLRSRQGAFGVLTALLLAGCASNTLETASLTDNTLLSPQEKALRAAVTEQRVVEGAAIGCGAGAAGTAIWGVITGRDRKQILKSAAVGCLAGGVVGAAAGAYVDARAQQYADEQARLKAMKAGAQRDIKHYQRLNAATRNLIRKEEQKIAALQAQGKVKQASIRSAEQTLAVQRQNVALLERQFKELDGNIKTIASDREELRKKGMDTRSLALEQEALEREKKQLERQIARLKDLYKKTA